MKESNIPRINRLTEQRLQKIRKLLQSYTTRDLTVVVQKAARSDFLNGRGRKNKFQATFDWLIEPENFLRVLEGNYP